MRSATVRAGVPAGVRRDTGVDWLGTFGAKGAAALRREHLRMRKTPVHAPVLHCLVLDCSASMLGNGSLARAKGMLLQLLRRFRREHAEVALICFGGGRADLRFGPAVPSGWNEQWIEPIGGGGGTPLALGLDEADRVLRRAARKRAGLQLTLWLLTDGRTAERPARPLAATEIVVVDFETARISLGGSQALADAWQARYLPSPSGKAGSNMHRG